MQDKPPMAAISPEEYRQQALDLAQGALPPWRRAAAGSDQRKHGALSCCPAMACM